MKFTLDISARLLDLFRLQTDGTFRAWEGTYGLRTGDQAFRTIEAVYRRIDQLKSPLSLGGKSVPLPDPELGYRYGDLVARPCVRVHRTKIPSAPTLANVRAAIAAGNDNARPSVLIIQLDGRVKLALTHDLRDRPKFAVKIDAFSAQGYTGVDAARDDSLVEVCFNRLLAGWIEHLRTGRMGVHSNVFTKTEAKLRAEIDEVAARGYSPTR